MYLPSPNFAFTIPSVYDGTQLDCRIYLPRDLQQADNASHWQKQGSIVAHPYASLGGCYDDPVVSFVGGELLQSGYVVGTFNFRYYTTSWEERGENAANMVCLGEQVALRDGRVGPQNLNWRIMCPFTGLCCIICVSWG